jgi:ADP-ribose pyrophosphatase
MSSEQFLSSREIYKGRVIKVRVDEVRLDNGHVTTREVMDHPGAIAIVPVDENRQVAMVKQYRYAAGQTMLEIPAGTRDRSEAPLETAIRELREETGLEAGRYTLLATFYPSPGVSSECMWVYLAEDLTSGEAHTEADESIEVTKIALNDALNLIARQEIHDAKSIVGLLLAKNHLEALP